MTYRRIKSQSFTLERVEKDGFFSSQIGRAYFCENTSCATAKPKIEIEYGIWSGYFQDDSLEKTCKILGYFTGRQFDDIACVKVELKFPIDTDPKVSVADIILSVVIKLIDSERKWDTAVIKELKKQGKYHAN